MRGVHTIELSIGELIIDGLAPGQGHACADAFSAALVALIEQQGRWLPFASELTELPPLEVTLAEGTSTNVGRGVALALFDALARAADAPGAAV